MVERRSSVPIPHCSRASLPPTANRPSRTRHSRAAVIATNRQRPRSEFLAPPDWKSFGSRYSQSLEHIVMWAIAADGVDCFRVASEQVGLATASTEILLFAGTGQAEFRHPPIAAKAIEGRRRLPYPAQRAVADVVECKAGDHCRGVAGHRLSDRVDEDHLPS